MLFIIFIVSCLFSFVVYGGVQFLHQDNFQLSWDEYYYYEFSIFYHAKLFNHNLIFKPLDTINHKAPLISLVSAFTYLAFPISEDNARIANFIFLGLSLIALAIIEYNVRKTYKNGIYSVFFFFMIPIFIVWSVRYYWPCIATTAMFLWFMAIMTKDINKINPWLLGFVIGLGFLGKPTFIALILYPMIYYIWKLFKKNGWKKVIINLLIIGFIALLTMGWWYIPNLKSIVNVYGSNIWGAEVTENEDTSSLFSIQHFAYYFNITTKDIPQFLLILLLLFIAFYFI